jgi:hypothetical protein
LAGFVAGETRILRQEAVLAALPMTAGMQVLQQGKEKQHFPAPGF